MSQEERNAYFSLMLENDIENHIEDMEKLRSYVHFYTYFFEHSSGSVGIVVFHRDSQFSLLSKNKYLYPFFLSKCLLSKARYRALEALVSTLEPYL